MISANLSAVFYLISGILFILALRGLSSPETSRQGNFFGILGMIIAITVTFLTVGNFSTAMNYVLLFLVIGGAIGAFIAFKIPMTAMPELVAGFHSLVGLAAVFVAISAFLNPEAFNLGSPGDIKLASLVEMSIGAAVGAITFSGSIIAFLKLRGIMSGSPITFIGQHFFNLILGISIIALIYFLCTTQSESFFWSMIVISFLIGVLLIIPIGGADMPVVVSLLNSMSGIAAAFTGFVIGNNVLIIAGSMVGAAGLILTFIMCKAMNRTLTAVLFKSFGGSSKETVSRTKVGSDPEEVAMVCDGITKCVIIPGYGMAVSQAQHAVKEFADLLEYQGVEVSYGIHPVAGRMPGHMNVLLAEANVPYEQLIEMDDINSELPDTDVAIIIGANDTVNPVARSGEGPLGGMPIIDADKARVVVIIKRSLSVGYAGVDNDLFYEDKTMMLFGDGKKMMNELNSAFKEL